MLGRFSLFRFKVSNGVMAAQRRQRLLAAAGEPEAFVKLGHEMVYPIFPPHAAVLRHGARRALHALVTELAGGAARLADCTPARHAVPRMHAGIARALICANMWLCACAAGLVRWLQAFGGTETEEVLQSMSSDDCERVWDALVQHVAADFDAESEPMLAVVDAICSFGCACLKTVPQHAPASMRRLVEALHDSLLRVEFETDVQDCMSRLCEAWYLVDPESRRYVVPQTILYLLLHSVGENGKLQDVKRVCAMREALLCIEISGQSFQSVQESILRAAIHPNYVMHDDGRRFLAFVLSIHPALTRCVHKTIKSQLPRCRKSMLLQYGELYHAAWKRASGPVLHALEHDCLQDMASHVINTASPSLSSSLRLVMSVFHNKKRFKAVDEMLARIYEPILWRSFKVANASIRVQAAQLLAEAFPVQNPEATAKEFEEGLTRQIRVLDALLKDPVPRVREVAVHCVSRVLSVYMELLPLHTTTSFLGLLINNLSMDAASAAVRAAVLRGLAVVLDNHISHPLLAQRLPLLGDRMHDSSESVRVAMAELLLKVRSVKAIKFFDVVALPDILSRLGADSSRPAVAKRLTKLLMPSYMPLNKPPAERLARILALVQQDALSAQVFLREAAAEVPTNEALKLLALMRHALARHLGGADADASPLKRKPGKQGQRLAGNGDADGQALVDGLVLCMSAVAESVQAMLDAPGVSEEDAAALRKDLVQALPSADESLHRLVQTDSGLALSVRARCGVWRMLAVSGYGADNLSSHTSKAMEESVQHAWRSGGTMEMQAVMQCMLSVPVDASADVHVSLVKRLLAPLTGSVKLWLRQVVASSASADAGSERSKAPKKSKTGKGKAAATAGDHDGDQDHQEAHVLERVKALLTCAPLRKRLLASPSCLAPLESALSGVLPAIGTALKAPGAGAEAALTHEHGLVQGLELYLTLLLHVHSAQFPGESGAGKAPEGMCEVLDMTARCAPCGDAALKLEGQLWHHVSSRVLLVCADACALNRCSAELARAIRQLIEKAAEVEISAALDAGFNEGAEERAGHPSAGSGAGGTVLHAIAKASFQLLRVGLETGSLSRIVGQLLESLPNHRLRLVGEVVTEVLRVAALHPAAAASPGGEHETTESGHSLRAATHELVQSCLRRLECSEEDAVEQLARPEEAAERVVGAAAAVGHEAMVLVAREVCQELEQCLSARASDKGKDSASLPDLSKIAAALALAHAVALRTRTSQAAAARSRGLQDVARSVMQVQAALEERASFAPGKRGLGTSAVASKASLCLSSLKGILPAEGVAA